MVSPAVSARLAASDAFLLDRAEPRTLAPDRARATLPSELGAALLTVADSPALCEAFADGLGLLVEAIVDAFPGNLLWDLDHLSATVLTHARTRVDPAATLGSALTSIAELQHRFGRASTIRFRYIHDFIYGFDWARWVAKDPATRTTVGPFDPAFVKRMHRRGRELAETIARGDDEKYPPLRGDAERNPFRFQREPEVELELHQLLAREGKLPVKSWCFVTVPRHDAPFTELREAAAEAL